MLYFHHVHITGCFFCIVTVILKASTTDPNTENTWKLFDDTLGALKIINGSWLSLSSELCFSQSALATGKQTRQTLWERGLCEFTAQTNLLSLPLSLGFLINHREPGCITQCVSHPKGNGQTTIIMFPS